MSDPIFEIGQAGLQTTEEKVESLVNRMVNAETPGFKGSEVVVRSFPLELEAAEKKYQSEVPRVESTFTNYEKGTLLNTKNPTDFALSSDGFFVVLGAWGEGYTRDGRFTADSEGRLVSTAGKFPLIGANGPIMIPPGASSIEMDQSGNLSADGKLIDRIRVVKFDSTQDLEPVNGSVFKNAEGKLNLTEVEAPRILQGYVEGSNVKAVDQMMELVVLNQLYNINTKIIQVRDGELTRALEMGKMQ